MRSEGVKPVLLFMAGKEMSQLTNGTSNLQHIAN
jgi:hypothetical protein